MTYTTCVCGADIDSETAAQRHARTCPVSGFPRGWRDRCPVPLGGDRRSPCGLALPCPEHEET